MPLQAAHPWPPHTIFSPQVLLNAIIEVNSSSSLVSSYLANFPMPVSYSHVWLLQNLCQEPRRHHSLLLLGQPQSSHSSVTKSPFLADCITPHRCLIFHLIASPLCFTWTATTSALRPTLLSLTVKGESSLSHRFEHTLGFTTVQNKTHCASYSFSFCRSLAPTNTPSMKDTSPGSSLNWRTHHTVKGWRLR